MGNTLIRSYSQKSLFLFLIFQAPRNDYPLRRNDNRRERQIIPANIPLTVVARRRIVISHNNDIVQVLLSHARSIHQMIFVTSGHGYINNAVLTRRPGEPPALNLVFDRRQIVNIRGIFQPREIVVPHHVIDTTVGRIPFPNVTVIGVSLLGIEGGEYVAHSLTTYGDVELETIFYTGAGPMFEQVAVDEPEASNAIRYI